MTVKISASVPDDVAAFLRANRFGVSAAVTEAARVHMGQRASRRQRLRAAAVAAAAEYQQLRERDPQEWAALEAARQHSDAMTLADSQW